MHHPSFPQTQCLHVHRPLRLTPICSNHAPHPSSLFSIFETWLLGEGLLRVIILDFHGSSLHHKIERSAQSKPAGSAELLRGRWGSERPKDTQRASLMWQHEIQQARGHSPQAQADCSFQKSSSSHYGSLTPFQNDLCIYVHVNFPLDQWRGGRRVLNFVNHWKDDNCIYWFFRHDADISELGSQWSEGISLPSALEL